MRELSKDDIDKNSVDTISQYKILDYLKRNLKTSEFKIFLMDKNNIKVVDRTNDTLYFSYDKTNNEIIFQNELVDIENDLEL